jgi:hypothetical protein
LLSLWLKTLEDCARFSSPILHSSESSHGFQSSEYYFAGHRRTPSGRVQLALPSFESTQINHFIRFDPFRSINPRTRANRVAIPFICPPIQLVRQRIHVGHPESHLLHPSKFRAVLSLTGKRGTVWPTCLDCRSRTRLRSSWSETTSVPILCSSDASMTLSIPGDNRIH